MPKCFISPPQGSESQGLQFVYRSFFYLDRHLTAPLLKERELFLRHLHKQGASREGIQNAACYLLRAIETLNLQKLRIVERSEIDRVILKLWGHELKKDTHFKGSASAYGFRSIVMKWLRFCDCFRPKKQLLRLPPKIAGYKAHLVSRHLQASTIERNVSSALSFYRWLASENIALSRVTIIDVDKYLTSKRPKGWAAENSRHATQSIRSFLYYAEARAWCRHDIARCVRRPSACRFAPLPQGRKWSEVKQLLRSIKGNDIPAARAKAALSIFATYALRIGEMSRLKISDFDFVKKTLFVRRSKNGMAQQYPLDEKVAYAVRQYVNMRRKSCDHLFLTIKTPYRPARAKSFYGITYYRLSKLGVTNGRRGPHAIRHARATELLRLGLTLRQVGDFLGHRDPESPLIYAKYSMESLRKVADLTMRGLL